MRLTRKDFNYQAPVLSKLSQLEDIEEELGIDLITLFKTLKNSMWYKHYDDEFKCYFIWDAHCYMKPLLNVYNKSIELKEYVDNVCSYGYVDKDVVYLKDYGKTWALTKEELK